MSTALKETFSVALEKARCVDRSKKITVSDPVMAFCLHTCMQPCMPMVHSFGDDTLQHTGLSLVEWMLTRPTQPCLSCNDRAALAASRGTHTVQAVPPGSSSATLRHTLQISCSLSHGQAYLASHGTVLCSATKSDFQLPGTRLKFGEWAFSVTAAKSWNNLPLHVRTADNTDTFKQRLKTFFIQHILSTTTPNCFYVIFYCINCNWLFSSAVSPYRLILLLLLF